MRQGRRRHLRQLLEGSRATFDAINDGQKQLDGVCNCAGRGSLGSYGRYGAHVQSGLYIEGGHISRLRKLRNAR